VPTLLTWEAIKLAKKLGDRRFDFEGIADERFPVTNKWLGFSRFKKSFGGNKIEYIGSFSKFNKEALWPLK
jgi:lipid II:glycine glycyltransferase (peptidoglycan interpeptide bridge formation enzyme)